MPVPLTDLSRLCIHTITTKPWSIEEAINKYSAAGVGGISVWRDTLEGRDLAAVRRQLSDSGLTPVSLVRGGFFTGDSEARQRALADNRRAIDEAAAIGAPLVVLVCGATPGQSVADNVDQVAAGIRSVLPHAAAAGVKLGIEPLHPMYADTRSVIATMKMANDLAASIDSPWVGVTVDVFHLWWDPDLEFEIRRCGELDRLFSFHVCDWKTPLEDLLLDRSLMGEGLIDVPVIRGWVEDAGFAGFIEVEIFSKRWWAADQDAFLEQIIAAYRQHT